MHGNFKFGFDLLKFHVRVVKLPTTAALLAVNSASNAPSMLSVAIRVVEVLLAVSSNASVQLDEVVNPLLRLRVRRRKMMDPLLGSHWHTLGIMTDGSSLSTDVLLPSSSFRHCQVRFPLSPVEFFCNLAIFHLLHLVAIFSFYAIFFSCLGWKVEEQK